MDIEILNPVYLADGRIDCTIIANGRELPYTASADDLEDYGRQIFAAAAGMDPVAYVAPVADPLADLAAERASMRVTRYQALATLYTAGLLDGVNAYIAKQPFLTQLAWNETTSFERTNAAMLAVAGALKISDTQLDDLFRAGMLLTL